jgi:RNA 2',3'-cyclic 3'-phosphodiesterase
VPRLFSAIELPEPVLTDLAARLPEVRAQAESLNWAPSDRWHITLGFYGDNDDPDRRIAWLRGRAAGLAAPRIRLSSAGRFAGVLWVGVEPADDTAEQALLAVAAAAGDEVADPLEFRPHVTVARWRRRRGRGPLAERAAAALAGYVGPWWTPPELILFRSALGAGGPRYSVVDRVALREQQ